MNIVSKIGSAQLLQLARYGITGIISVSTYVGLLALFGKLSILPVLAYNFIAYAVATLVNYVLNYNWVFVATRSHRQASWRFLVVVLIGIVSNSIYVSTVIALTNVPPQWAGLSFSLLWPLVSFACMKLWALT